MKDSDGSLTLDRIDLKILSKLQKTDELLIRNLPILSVYPPAHV
jgi:hypothetical protein